MPIIERLTQAIARSTGRPSRRALAADVKHFRQSLELEVAKSDARLAEMTKASADARAAEQDRKKVTEQLNRVLQIGVNPYLAGLLNSMAAVDLANPNGDLCFIGPNGCQTHPGFAIGRDKECGIAWLRGWIMDGGSQENTPGLLAIGQMLAEHDDAAGVIADALAAAYPDFELAAMVAKEGDPGWGDRHLARLVRDLIHAFRSAS